MGTSSASYRKSFPGFCHYRRHNPPPNYSWNECLVQDAFIRGQQVQVLWGQHVLEGIAAPHNSSGGFADTADTAIFQKQLPTKITWGIILPENRSEESQPSYPFLPPDTSGTMVSTIYFWLFNKELFQIYPYFWVRTRSVKQENSSSSVFFLLCSLAIRKYKSASIYLLQH